MTNYQTIMTSNEAIGIRPVTEKWMMLSENLKKRGSKIFRLPDLFWRVTPGVGTTTLLKVFAAFIEERENLIPHQGELTVLEKTLSYCYAQDSKQLQDNLSEAMENATGYTDSFTGILALHLNEWLGHANERPFTELMEKLKRHDRKMLIVFILPAGRQEAEEMEQTLAQLFRLEEVELTVPKTAMLLGFVCEKLKEEGITLDDNASALLEKTIAKLRNMRCFKGYNTLTMLYEDIAYAAFTSVPFPENGVLTADMLSGFAVGSAYIKRLEKKEAATQRIGF